MRHRRWARFWTTSSAATGHSGKAALSRPLSRTWQRCRSTGSGSRLPPRPGRCSVPAMLAFRSPSRASPRCSPWPWRSRGDRSGTLWSRVLREPSGTSFNSLVQLEVEHGIPRNPFINAGALVVTDHLMKETPDAAARLLRFLTAQAGSAGPFIDEAAAAGELSSSSRNLALAHFLKDFGNLAQPAESVVANYVRQCSIMMTCVELAKAGLFLARRRPGNTRNRGVSQRGETHRLHHADLRHVRRRRRVRLPRWACPEKAAWAAGSWSSSQANAPSASGVRGWTPKETPWPAPQPLPTSPTAPAGPFSKCPGCTARQHSSPTLLRSSPTRKDQPCPTTPMTRL